MTPHKKGAQSERYRLRTLRAGVIGSCPLERLTPEVVASYRDQRLKQVSRASVRRELTILRHCLEKARKEWGAPLAANPVAAIERPKDAPSRTRRVTAEDARKLVEGLKGTRNPWLQRVIDFAIHTGMRRSEILALTWADINCEARTAHLADTKNGQPRTVPLSPSAMEAIPPRPLGVTGADVVFSVTPNALRLAWERLKRRSQVEDLRFHDLRHEAITRFFEQNLSAPEVALISGHRDPRMLQRYTHLRAVDIAKKLRRLEESPSET